MYVDYINALECIVCACICKYLCTWNFLDLHKTPAQCLLYNKHSTNVSYWLLFLLLERVSGSESVLFLSQRWIRWSMQWASQSAWQKRNLRGYQDFESWLYRQTEEGLPEWGQHHGTVWPPKYHSLGRRCHQMYVRRSLYKAKLEVTGKLNTHFLSREMTDGADPLIANRRKSVQDKSLIL